jgi:hypothetical protein
MVPDTFVNVAVDTPFSVAVGALVPSLSVTHTTRSLLLPPDGPVYMNESDVTAAKCLRERLSVSRIVGDDVTALDDVPEVSKLVRIFPSAPYVNVWVYGLEEAAMVVAESNRLRES